MKKTGLIFIVMMIALLLFSTCDEGMFGSLEKLEEQAIEENAPSAGVTKYTVTFDMNEGAGTAPAAQTVEAGTEITLPSGSGFARSGFGFDGWNTEIDGSGDDLTAGSAYTVNGNVTLYAKWSTSYTVEFNLNNGTGTTPTAQTVSPGATITLPDEDIGFSRSGFTFAGWNTNPNGLGTDYLAGPYTVNASVTLYAKWTCTIIFNINNGDGTVPSPQTGVAGSIITLPGSTGFSRPGYSFDGWNTNPSGTGDSYTAGEQYPMNGDRTLYVKWNTISGTVYHTVKFELNGVEDIEGIYGDLDCKEGEPVARPKEPVKANFTFGGWYNNSGFSGAAYNFNNPVNGPLTLYVKWRSTVKFETNGGSDVPDDQVVDIGATVAPVTDPKKDHYTFEGWYSDIGLTPANKWNFGSSTAESNMTLYANWTPVQYTVTYNINGGSGSTPAAVTAAYNSSITLNAGDGLSKRGCSFGGWNTNSSGSGNNYTSTYDVTGNITLYAKWDVITNPPGSTLTAKLDWLDENAISDVNYTLETNIINEPIIPRTLSYGSYTNISVKLVGNTSNLILSLPGGETGSMFTVPSGITLVLENLTLKGHDSNNGALVRVNSGGKLTMNNGSLITGNTSTSVDNGFGGGVYITAGSLTMNEGSKITENHALGSNNNGGGVSTAGASTVSINGAEISGNTSTMAGGGLYVFGGTITMNGGKISGNTSRRGGGVWTTATFTMSNGAVVFDNEATSSTTGDGGGGVFVNTDGNFTLSDGSTISGNTTVTYGGGVYVSGGTFTMNGSATKISGNTATSSSSYGVGVYLGSGSEFTMTGGTIGGTTPADANTARTSGGGVYVNGAEFEMSGGVISGNATTTTGAGAGLGGGGVYINNGGKFTLSGSAIISGNTTTSPSSTSGGAGVHVTGSTSRFDMNGGKISGNIASGSNSGGGVFASGGAIFNMTSGTIGGTDPSDANIAEGGGGGAGIGGGGVALSGGSSEFTMSGDAAIKGNISAGTGGGVSVRTNASFTMKGNAIISGNEASGNSGVGGGVYVNTGTFTMEENGTISGNKSALNVNTLGGGGVYVMGSSSNAGTFEMKGGTISGNTAAANGGGVRLASANAIFKKTGGTITGYGSYVSGDDSAFNAVKNGSTFNSNRGHAVFVGTNTTTYVKRHEQTISTNLEYDGTVDPATFSGNWDY